MTQKESTGTAPAANAPHWTSRWRATYRQGDWLVLSGPTSLVVMQPAAPQWSELINAIWEDVLAAGSMADLATRLTDFRLDGMPDFAALFWERDQMRSLVRGAVRLVDPDTGRQVASGDGVQTWTEVGLGDLQQVEVQAGDQSDAEQLELPLVIGAVNASRVLLDAGDEMQIRSPQGTFVGDVDGLDRLDAPAEPAAAEPAAPTGAGPAGGVEDAEPGRPAHAAEDDADRAETLVDQPPVRPDAAPSGSAPSGSAPSGSAPSDADRAGTERPGTDDGSAPGSSGDGERDDRGPQHASHGAPAGAAGGAALGAAALGAAGAGAAGAAAAGASGAGAAGTGAAATGAAGTGAAATGGSVAGGSAAPGSGSADSGAPSGPPNSPQSSPGQSSPGQSSSWQSGGGDRPEPVAAGSNAAGRADDDQEDDGHTMIGDSLPGLGGRGRTDEPAQRPVLGVLHPSSGGTVDIDRPVVIGRAPVASRVRSDQLPRLLTVPSPSHDISRTHVQIAPENGRLVVTDLNSTNGTILVLPDGRRTDLRPGVGVPAEFGSVIDLGDGITIAVDHG
ncbi:FHA domain-containing protein [Microlunatus soli]|uniref:FHA domain-containing protein n=1 Tax=Microlunatus soli TaxID=630515 RepID=A0A1H1VFT9_9ACTN|nr:FHA domain-containing protein [Microlunatus soli]SDS83276.1 FHA domain-containing protein [Microlunatus soli]